MEEGKLFSFGFIVYVLCNAEVPQVCQPTLIHGLTPLEPATGVVSGGLEAIQQAALSSGGEGLPCRTGPRFLGRATGRRCSGQRHVGDQKPTLQQRLCQRPALWQISQRNPKCELSLPTAAGTPWLTVTRHCAPLGYSPSCRPGPGGWGAGPGKSCRSGSILGSSKLWQIPLRRSSYIQVRTERK